MTVRKGLGQANILRTNNNTSTGYGVVYADEVSGHRTVANLTALYALNDWQLSASGDNTNSDAIGQLWYVVDADGKGNGALYQLKDWSKRKEAAGWSIANMKQNAEGLGIHKVYASYAAMVADASAPVGSNGKALRFGQLVVIYDSNNTTQAESGNIYAWQEGNTGADAWLLIGNLGSVSALISKNAMFAGIATPTTNPGTPEVPVFYIANGKGTYTNFGGIDVTEDEVVILYWDTAWHKVATGIASNDKLTELDEVIYGERENIVLSPSATGTYINPSGAGQIGTPFTANVPVDGSATSNCYKIAVKMGERYVIYGKGRNEYVPLYLLTGNGNIVLDRKNGYDSRTNPVVLDITEDGYLYSNAWEPVSTDKIIKVTKVSEGLLADVAEINDEISDIKTSVEELDKIIDGSESIIKAVTSTKDEYNVCLFDSPIPAGSIITSIDRSVYNMNMYLVKMDGQLDISVNYYDIADHLPYTTTQEYKGVSLNKAGTLTIKIGEDVPSVNERLKKLETLRKPIYINREDTEFDVLTKMLLAFETGNIDVIFPDNAYYELNNVYEYMKQTLNWGWTLGLPIGNGCRYYGNGTIIKSTFIKAEHSDFASDAISIFDTKARGNNLEVYDFVLINNGGTYCIHDEGYNTTTPYFHKYSNLYLQCDTLTCFGCGVGFNASIFMQNCLFRADTTNNNRNFLLHAPQNNPDNKKVNLYVKIDGCYFASDIPIGINPVGFDVSRDETILVISNSKYSRDLLEDTKSVIKDLIIYNNNL